MDRLDSLEAFVSVIEQEGFAAAGRQLGLSRSQVSRLVAQLEDQLNVQLLHRTTRKVSPTSVGKAFYERTKAVLDDLEEAAATAAAHQDQAVGKIRINTPVSIPGVDFSEAIVEFMCQHSRVEVELTMEARMVDPVADGYDLVVRVAEPDEETELVDHRILSLEYGMYASAQYVDRHGTPGVPEDLKDHQTLGYGLGRQAGEWKMTGPSGDVSIRVSPRLTSNHRETLFAGVRNHLGIAIMPEFSMSSVLESGEVIRVLPDYHCSHMMLQVIYPPARHLSAKVRLLTDFLVERFERRLR